eukprot:1691677-Pyramimonas_sp.AAC.1
MSGETRPRALSSFPRGPTDPSRWIHGSTCCNGSTDPPHELTDQRINNGSTDQQRINGSANGSTDQQRINGSTSRVLYVAYVTWHLVHDTCDMCKTIVTEALGILAVVLCVGEFDSLTDAEKFQELSGASGGFWWPRICRAGMGVDQFWDFWRSLKAWEGFWRIFWQASDRRWRERGWRKNNEMAFFGQGLRGASIT